MAKDTEILMTLTSFFYDCAKEIPIGTLNRILMNTVISEDNEHAMEVAFCDRELEVWAKKFAEQLIDYRTKFTVEQLRIMGYHKTISKNREIARVSNEQKYEKVEE